MLRRLRAIALWIYDFVVGDDWLLAIGVIVALAATAVAATVGWPAWLFAPVIILAALVWSTLRGARSALAEAPSHH